VSRRWGLGVAIEPLAILGMLNCGDKFGLEEYEGLRNNELRAVKARSPSRLGGLESVVSSSAGSGAEPQPPTHFRAF